MLEHYICRLVGDPVMASSQSSPVTVMQGSGKSWLSLQSHVWELRYCVCKQSMSNGKKVLLLRGLNGASDIWLPDVHQYQGRQFAPDSTMDPGAGKMRSQVCGTSCGEDRSPSLLWSLQDTHTSYPDHGCCVDC